MLLLLQPNYTMFIPYINTYDINIMPLIHRIYSLYVIYTLYNIIYKTYNVHCCITISIAPVCICNIIHINLSIEYY